jgi:hypothetical protein
MIASKRCLEAICVKLALLGADVLVVLPCGEGIRLVLAVTRGTWWLVVNGCRGSEVSTWVVEEEAPSQLDLGNVNNRQCPA